MWRAAKKFGNFFSGDLGELSRDYRTRRGQVRAVGWLTGRCEGFRPAGDLWSCDHALPGNPEVVFGEKMSFRVFQSD